VVACGPEGIVMEAKNAVAGLGVVERVNCGGVGFHGECYNL
jgi:ferric-chelate reductase